MVLTQEEIDGCRDAFLAFDKDRSGNIDVWELRQVGRRSYGVGGAVGGWSIVNRHNTNFADFLHLPCLACLACDLVIFTRVCESAGRTG